MNWKRPGLELSVRGGKGKGWHDGSERLLSASPAVGGSLGKQTEWLGTPPQPPPPPCDWTLWGDPSGRRRQLLGQTSGPRRRTDGCSGTPIDWVVRALDTRYHMYCTRALWIPAQTHGSEQLLN